MAATPSFSSFKFETIGRNSLLYRISSAVPQAQTNVMVGEEPEEDDLYVDMDLETPEPPERQPGLLARLSDPVSTSGSMVATFFRPDGTFSPRAFTPAVVPPETHPTIGVCTLRQSVTGMGLSSEEKSRTESSKNAGEAIMPSTTQIGGLYVETSTIEDASKAALSEEDPLPMAGSIHSGLPSPPPSALSVAREINDIPLSTKASLMPAQTNISVFSSSPFPPLSQLLQEERAAWSEVWETKRTQVQVSSSGISNPLQTSLPLSNLPQQSSAPAPVSSEQIHQGHALFMTKQQLDSAAVPSQGQSDLFVVPSVANLQNTVNRGALPSFSRSIGAVHSSGSANNLSISSKDLTFSHLGANDVSLTTAQLPEQNFVATLISHQQGPERSIAGVRQSSSTQSFDAQERCLLHPPCENEQRAQPKARGASCDSAPKISLEQDDKRQDSSIPDSHAHIRAESATLMNVAGSASASALVSAGLPERPSTVAAFSSSMRDGRRPCLHLGKDGDPDATPFLPESVLSAKRKASSSIPPPGGDRKDKQASKRKRTKAALSETKIDVNASSALQSSAGPCPPPSLPPKPTFGTHPLPPKPIAMTHGDASPVNFAGVKRKKSCSPIVKTEESDSVPSAFTLHTHPVKRPKKEEEDENFKIRVKVEEDLKALAKGADTNLPNVPLKAPKDEEGDDSENEVSRTLCKDMPTHREQATVSQEQLSDALHTHSLTSFVCSSLAEQQQDTQDQDIQEQALEQQEPDCLTESISTSSAVATLVSQDSETSQDAAGQSHTAVSEQRGLVGCALFAPTQRESPSNSPRSEGTLDNPQLHIYQDGLHESSERPVQIPPRPASSQSGIAREAVRSPYSLHGKSLSRQSSISDSRVARRSPVPDRGRRQAGREVRRRGRSHSREFSPPLRDHWSPPRPLASIRSRPADTYRPPTPSPERTPRTPGRTFDSYRPDRDRERFPPRMSRREQDWNLPYRGRSASPIRRLAQPDSTSRVPDPFPLRRESDRRGERARNGPADVKCSYSRTDTRSSFEDRGSSIVERADQRFVLSRRSSEDPANRDHREQVLDYDETARKVSYANRQFMPNPTYLRSIAERERTLSGASEPRNPVSDEQLNVSFHERVERERDTVGNQQALASPATQPVEIPRHARSPRLPPGGEEHSRTAPSAPRNETNTISSECASGPSVPPTNSSSDADNQTTVPQYSVNGPPVLESNAISLEDRKAPSAGAHSFRDVERAENADAARMCDDDRPGYARLQNTNNTSQAEWNDREPQRVSNYPSSDVLNVSKSSETDLQRAPPTTPRTAKFRDSPPSPASKKKEEKKEENSKLLVRIQRPSASGRYFGQDSTATGGGEISDSRALKDCIIDGPTKGTSDSDSKVSPAIDLASRISNVLISDESHTSDSCIEQDQAPSPPGIPLYLRFSEQVPHASSTRHPLPPRPDPFHDTLDRDGRNEHPGTHRHPVPPPSREPALLRRIEQEEGSSYKTVEPRRQEQGRRGFPNIQRGRGHKNIFSSSRAYNSNSSASRKPSLGERLS